MKDWLKRVAETLKKIEADNDVPSKYKIWAKAVRWDIENILKESNHE